MISGKRIASLLWHAAAARPAATPSISFGIIARHAPAINGEKQFRANGAEQIVDKPSVCGRGLPGRLSTHRSALTLARCSVAAHRPRLRRGCVPPLRTSLRSVSSGLQPLRGLWLRTTLRSVCSPLQPFGPPTASDRDGNVFFSANASICSRKIPEMTYTPSFLIRTSFFRGFVNTLSARMGLGFFLCPQIGKIGVPKLGKLVSPNWEKFF